jgi:hypothetical protein
VTTRVNTQLCWSVTGTQGGTAIVCASIAASFNWSVRDDMQTMSLAASGIAQMKAKDQVGLYFYNYKDNGHTVLGELKCEGTGAVSMFQVA